MLSDLSRHLWSLPDFDSQVRQGCIINTSTGRKFHQQLRFSLPVMIAAGESSIDDSEAFVQNYC